MTAELIALPPLLALSAFFSGSETVLFSLTASQRARIKARSAKADARIARCLADKAVLFSTLLVGNTFVNFILSTVGYCLFDNLGFDGSGLLALPVMTLLLLLFGEITPKRLALRYAEQIAPFCARAIWFWRTILSPFNFVLRFSSRAFAAALERERRALSDDELVSVMEAAAEHGEVTASDAQMVEGVLRLSELHANDEMTPRVDIEGIDFDLPEEAQRQAVANARHSYLPVFRRSPDAIIDVMDVRANRVEPALFVPEQMSLDDLLTTFRRTGKPLAVVLDEYGGAAGIITPNDVMEIIVGPGVFSRPDDEPSIKQETERTWIIDGRASLDEINRELGIELEAADADRLSGWVAYHAECVPRVGQEIVADGCRATVTRRRRRRVEQVRLEVLEFPRTASDAEMLAETDEAVHKTEEDE